MRKPETNHNVIFLKAYTSICIYKFRLGIDKKFIDMYYFREFFKRLNGFLKNFQKNFLHPKILHSCTPKFFKR